MIVINILHQYDNPQLHQLHHFKSGLILSPSEKEKEPVLKNAFHIQSPFSFGEGLGIRPN